MSGEKEIVPANLFGRELERINGPDATEVLALMDEGIQKRLVIFYKPFGGNALYFYDQNLAPILDVLSLYRAVFVIFTNQPRAPGRGLEGLTLFDQNVTMFGAPSLSNRLRLRYPGGEYANFRSMHGAGTSMLSSRQERLFNEAVRGANSTFNDVAGIATTITMCVPLWPSNPNKHSPVRS